MRLVLAALVAVLGLFAALADARACACCTHIGQRSVATVKFDSEKRFQIEDLKFGKSAELYVAEADVEDVKGITTPSQLYDLEVTRTPDRMVFAFRDKAAHAGTLTLFYPATVSIFEVDPRTDASEGGTGPSLYKEWKLTSRVAGTGIFSAGMGDRQRLTLIVHGHGNSCTSSIDFGQWTLVMEGPKGAYKLYGALQRTH
jgi:hypothetical protein